MNTTLYFINGTELKTHLSDLDKRELLSNWDDWMCSQRNPILYTVNELSFRLDQLLAIKEV